MWEKIKAWGRGLFPHEKKVRYLLVAFTALVLFALATNCHGAVVDVGMGTTVTRGYTPTITVMVVWPEVAADADIECGATLIGQTSARRGVMGFSCGLTDGFGPVSLGVGVIYLNHTDDLNGSNENFYLKLGYRFTPKWSAEYRHISNSGTTDINTGRDFLQLVRRF